MFGLKQSFRSLSKIFLFSFFILQQLNDHLDIVMVLTFLPLCYAYIYTILTCIGSKICLNTKYHTSIAKFRKRKYLKHIQYIQKIYSFLETLDFHIQTNLQENLHLFKVKMQKKSSIFKRFISNSLCIISLQKND